MNKILAILIIVGILTVPVTAIPDSIPAPEPIASCISHEGPRFIGPCIKDSLDGGPPVVRGRR